MTRNDATRRPGDPKTTLSCCSLPPATWPGASCCPGCSTCTRQACCRASTAPETARGLRRMVLDATPLPALPEAPAPETVEPPCTKKAVLLALYRAGRRPRHRCPARTGRALRIGLDRDTHHAQLADLGRKASDRGDQQVTKDAESTLRRFLQAPSRFPAEHPSG
jgi:hypothetical protein